MRGPETTSGETESEEVLFASLRSELYRRAEQLMRRERADHTLQPTALLHEAWLRIGGPRPMAWNDSRHFLCVATRAMREVLIDRARARQADKRGGGAEAEELVEGPAPAEPLWRLLVLDEALEELRRLDERLFRVAELRIFGGLEHEEIGRVLCVSTRTVERAWRAAQAWLKDRVPDSR